MSSEHHRPHDGAEAVAAIEAAAESFGAANMAWAVGKFPAVRMACAKVLAANGLPAHYRSYAHLRARAAVRALKAEGLPAGGVAGQAAIRFDDAISGMLVYGNIFHLLPYVSSAAWGHPCSPPVDRRGLTRHGMMNMGGYREPQIFSADHFGVAPP